VKALHDAAHLRRGHGCRAAAEQAQRAQVEAVEVGLREQRRVDRRHRVEVGHPLARDGLENGARLGPRQDDRGRAAVPEAERQRPAAHVEHGKHAEGDVVFAEALLQVRRGALQPVAAMREERAFRRSGRAAGVEHDVRIVLVDAGVDVVAGFGVGEGGEVGRVGQRRAGIEGDDAPHARQPAVRLQVRDQAGELAGDQERLRLGMADHGRDLRRGEARVDRHDDGAELDDGEVDDRILRAIRRQHGDAVAAPHAAARQCTGELIGAGVKRGVGQARGADDVRRLSPRTQAWRRRMSPSTSTAATSARSESRGSGAGRR
jgi:hypothetical protein